MIGNGLSLAFLTGTGFYLIYRKLPRRIRKFMQKHVLFTDAIMCLATYMLFGGTLVALFASAWMGIIVSIVLALTSNPRTNYLLEQFAEKLVSLKNAFLDWVSRQVPERPEVKEIEGTN